MWFTMCRMRAEHLHGTAEDAPTRQAQRPIPVGAAIGYRKQTGLHFRQHGAVAACLHCARKQPGRCVRGTFPTDVVEALLA